MSQEIALQRIRGILNARCLLACLGLAFYWPMFRSPFLGTALTLSPTASLDPHLLFYVFLLALGLLAVAPISPTTKLLSLIEERPLFGLASGMTAAFGSTALLLSAFAQGSVCHISTLAGSLFLAGGFALLTLTWARLLASLATDQALVCLHASFLASFLFGVFDFSPTALNALRLILPIGSGVAASVVQAKSDITRKNSIGDWAATTFDSRLLVLGIVFGMVVGLIACGILRSLWIGSASSYKPSMGILPTYAISASIAAILLFLLLFTPGRRKSLFTGLALLFALLLSAIALCSTLGYKPALSLTASVRTSFEFYLWCFLVLVGTDETRSKHRLWGAFLVINPLSLLLTSYAMPFLLGVNSENSGEYASGLAILSLFIVAIAFIAIAAALVWRIEKNWDNEADGSSQAKALDQTAGTAGKPNEGRDVAALLVERCGLTEREAEIASYFARGYSVKKTAETLCLSQSTVQYHAKSIYRKMGINSKQSLIEEVEALL